MSNKWSTTRTRFKFIYFKANSIQCDNHVFKNNHVSSTRHRRIRFNRLETLDTYRNLWIFHTHHSTTSFHAFSEFRWYSLRGSTKKIEIEIQRIYSSRNEKFRPFRRMQLLTDSLFPSPATTDPRLFIFMYNTLYYMYNTHFSRKLFTLYTSSLRLYFSDTNWCSCLADEYPCITILQSFTKSSKNSYDRCNGIKRNKRMKDDLLGKNVSSLLLENWIREASILITLDDQEVKCLPNTLNESIFTCTVSQRWWVGYDQLCSSKIIPPFQKKSTLSDLKLFPSKPPLLLPTPKSKWKKIFCKIEDVSYRRNNLRINFETQRIIRRNSLNDTILTTVQGNSDNRC